jgi:hypothetical protein
VWQGRRGDPSPYADSSLESSPLGKINLAIASSAISLTSAAIGRVRISAPAHEVSKIPEGFVIFDSSQRL